MGAALAGRSPADLSAEVSTKAEVPIYWDEGGSIANFKDPFSGAQACLNSLNSYLLPNLWAQHSAKSTRDPEEDMNLGRRAKSSKELLSGPQD